KKWIPGMYPETEEERKAAAEKYGLHPYEYKPYPNDEHSVGDYPELPQLSVEAQDPYYPWDFPASRRNYNEPVHRHFDIMGPDHVAYGVRTREDYHKCALIFVGLIVSYLVFSLHTVDTKPAFAEKQYPGKGKVHYTFEPAK
ncbi:NADH dehydrogenase [ubiquinone] 1 beta subcomplex subunit 8, mitochondrial, partial [Dufourea novaeangliae]